MSYTRDPVTESEREGLYGSAIAGLIGASIALYCHATGMDFPLAWLATVVAGSCLFLLAFNWRARDEYFDRLNLAGARAALGLLGVWVCVEALIYQFGARHDVQPVRFLRDQMIALSAVMTTYFTVFNVAHWRRQ